jgi:S-adenosylmethionine:tRNA ribosyltransferase-isomerase
VIAADRALRRPASARLLLVEPDGRVVHAPRARWLDFLRAGDAVIANDAATLPASLCGVHDRSGEPVEVRLAARPAQPHAEVAPRYDAIVFGAGDWRTRTEDRPAPPALRPGDRLTLGPLRAEVLRTLGHPRLARLRFDAPPETFVRMLAAHGRPIQYAHLREPLALWDTWTPIAAAPVAFEAPSAAFALDWQALAAMRTRGIAFATLTHAAGISSTGDRSLDRRLPFDERYRIPESTARLIARTRRHEGRVIAVGTTVVRALEHAACEGLGVRAGDGIATQRLGAATILRVVSGLLTGTHEPGSSHHELLRAFATDATLARALAALEAMHYRTHEFGDSMLVWARSREARPATDWAAAA